MSRLIAPNRDDDEPLCDDIVHAKMPTHQREVNMPQVHTTPSPATFSSPIDDRYFEDYIVGAVHEFGAVAVSEQEIIEFARRYDPQDFHIDPRKAAESRFGGLIASGWLTCGLMMRMFTEHYLTRNASLSSPGLDEVRWLAPVRPGDTLSARVTVLEARRSTSKPDRGLVRSRIEVLNQRADVVMSLVAMNLIACRAVPSA